MKPWLIRSRFRGVYCGLGALWATVCLGIHLLNSTVVMPNIFAARAHNIESLLRSHSDELQLDDTRPIRDALLNDKVIDDDRYFSLIRLNNSESQEKARLLKESCKFITDRTCTREGRALIFSGDPRSKIVETSYIIALSTSELTSVTGAIWWEVFASLALGCILLFVAAGIRSQERFLLDRIDLLLSSIRKIESSFGADSVEADGPQHEVDEFQSISKGIEQAAMLLDQRTGQIEAYRTRFERKTRLELFAETISYTSHNLKAPLQEGAEFLRDLPAFIERMPRETLLRAIRSLEVRLRDGADSLQQALAATREGIADAENISVSRILADFRDRVTANPGLSEVRVDFSANAHDDHAYCSPSEMNAVLWNLLKNSIEAKRDSQISLSCQVTGPDVVVDFRDDGPGIPDEVLDTVFDDFYTSKSRGSGLGLSSVRRSIEKANGQIHALRARSGAHFQIRLPLAGPDRRSHA